MLESISKNKKGIIFILMSAFLLALGQLLWKISIGKSSETGINLTTLGILIGGFVCYGIGAITMIIAFKYGSMSVLHPMMSVSLFFSIIFGYFVLGEQVTIYKVLGILLIFTGILFIGGGDQ